MCIWKFLVRCKLKVVNISCVCVCAFTLCQTLPPLKQFKSYLSFLLLNSYNHYSSLSKSPLASLHLFLGPTQLKLQLGFGDSTSAIRADPSTSSSQTGQSAIKSSLTQFSLPASAWVQTTLRHKRSTSGHNPSLAKPGLFALHFPRLTSKDFHAWTRYDQTDTVCTFLPQTQVRKEYERQVTFLWVNYDSKTAIFWHLLTWLCKLGMTSRSFGSELHNSVDSKPVRPWQPHFDRALWLVY